MVKVTAVQSFTAKILACIAAIACVAVGLVGLIVPILPGVLFLAIAAGIIATQFPSVGERLKQNPAFSVHLKSLDRWRHVSFSRKLRAAPLLCAKMILDSLVAAISLAGRVVRQRTR